jgi:hypothetical protein
MLMTFQDSVSPYALKIKTLSVCYLPITATHLVLGDQPSIITVIPPPKPVLLIVQLTPLYTPIVPPTTAYKHVRTVLMLLTLTEPAKPHVPITSTLTMYPVSAYQPAL